MRVLEIFSGTGSVGKVCTELGYEVISVDIDDTHNTPTHLTDIMKWDYKIYPVNHFDIIWASPPCTMFSCLRQCWIGRTIKAHGDKILTREMLNEDINKIGLPLLRKTEEIIDYFNPPLYIIENPGTGKMKNYIDRPLFVVDYCKYADWGYKKRTHIWTNKTNFAPKTCKKDCGSLTTVNDKTIHTVALGTKEYIKDGDKMIKVDNAELRERYKDVKRVFSSTSTKLSERYRVPPQLIKDLLSI